MSFFLAFSKASGRLHVLKSTDIGGGKNAQFFHTHNDYLKKKNLECQKF